MPRRIEVLDGRIITDVRSASRSPSTGGQNR
jgi:hypothetical protein